MDTPPVFVINLDKSPQRMARIAKRLNELDIPFERVAAVYGSNLSEYDLNSAYSSRLNARTYRRPLTMGEIGCYMSHLKAWKIIVDRSIPCALVIEDDILIESNVKMLSKKLAKFANSYDIVKFFCKKTNPKIIERVPVSGGYDLCRFNKVPIGNLAQLISLEGAKKLLKTYSTFGRSVDEDIQHWWEADLNVLGIFPSAVNIIKNAESDIDNQGKRKNKTSFIGSIRNIWIRIKYQFNLRINKKNFPLPNLDD
jgi:glycosyl transferase family 25